MLYLAHGVRTRVKLEQNASLRLQVTGTTFTDSFIKSSREFIPRLMGYQCVIDITIKIKRLFIE